MHCSRIIFNDLANLPLLQASAGSSVPDKETCKERCELQEKKCNIYIYDKDHNECRIFIDSSIDIKMFISGANVIGGPTNCPHTSSICVSLKEIIGWG